MFAPPVAKSKSRADAAPRFPNQAALEVGAVDDPLEQEADRVADEVGRTPDGATGVPRTRLRTGPSPDSFGGRGEPLPSPVRGFFERRLHHDFGSVRVHHDAQAADSARSLGARAYTYGRDIVFGAGAYAPRSSEGHRLLAHELTHVTQQRGATPTTDMTVSEPGDASEVEASSIADQVASAPSSASQQTAAVSRAAEEEELQMSRIDRASPEEEEPMQG